MKNFIIGTLMVLIGFICGLFVGVVETALGLESNKHIQNIIKELGEINKIK